MSQPIKSDELFSAIRRGQWTAHYVLAGSEDFLMEDALRTIVQHWLSQDSSGLNLDRFDGGSHSPAEIIQAAQTLPFLSPVRVVRIDHLEAFSKSDQQTLADALPRLPAETRIMVQWQSDWRRETASQPLIDAVLERGGTVAIFWPPFPEQAQRWAIERARLAYHKALEPQAAAWLISQAQPGLRFIDVELAKCASLVGKRPSIELDDVQESFGFSRAASPFEWIAALRRKDTPAALRLLERMKSEGEEPVRLMALLTRSLRDWLAARSSGEPASMLAMRFHLRRGEEHRFSQELARWEEHELTRALASAIQAEQDMKTGQDTPIMRLTLLTVELGGLLQTADFAG